MLPTPSIAPNQLHVTQTISGSSYAEYVKSPDVYDRTFKEAIVASLQPLVGDSITFNSVRNFRVTYEWPSWASKQRRLSLSELPLVIYYVLDSSSVIHIH